MFVGASQKGQDKCLGDDLFSAFGKDCDFAKVIMWAVTITSVSGLPGGHLVWEKPDRFLKEYPGVLFTSPLGLLK